MMNSLNFLKKTLIGSLILAVGLLANIYAMKINIPIHWIYTASGTPIVSLPCPSGQALQGFNETTGEPICVTVDTNPSDDITQINVQDPTETTQFTITSSANYIRFAPGDGIIIRFDNANHQITIADENANSEITGSGIKNYLAKFTDTRTIGNSQIYDTGANIGIGTTSPGWKVDVRATGDYVFHLGDNSGNDFTIDIAGGQGLVNLVAGAKVASGTNYYVYTGSRGASRIELHDGTFYLMVGGTSGSAGQQVSWKTVMQGLSSGNAYFPYSVGIGTSSPSEKLEVAGNIKASKFIDRDDTTYYVDPNGATSAILAGNVGIGTSSPAEKLHVNGNIRADGYIYSESDPTYDPAVRLRTWGLDKSDKHLFIEWGNGDGGDTFYITDHWKYVSPIDIRAGKIMFRTGNGTAGYYKDRLIINSGSNYVQIDIQNAALDMNNNNIINANAITIADPGYNEGISWGGSQAKIYVAPLDDSNADGYLQLVNDQGIAFEPGGEGNTAVVFDATGKVGINTTSPDATLSIKGNMTINPGISNFGLKIYGGKPAIYLDSPYITGIQIENAYNGIYINEASNYGILMRHPTYGIRISQPEYNAIEIYQPDYYTGSYGIKIDMYDSDKVAIYTNGKIRGRAFIDNDDTDYYVDPSGTTNLYNLNIYNVQEVSDNNKVLTLSGNTVASIDTTNWDKNKNDDITGSGTAGYIPYFTGTRTIGKSIIYYDSANSKIGIGTASPSYKLDVSGWARVTGRLYVGETIQDPDDSDVNIGEDLTVSGKIKVGGNKILDSTGTARIEFDTTNKNVIIYVG